MSRRLELHDKLLSFVDNVYFQPPSNIQLTFPCIVYQKSDIYKPHANDDAYLKTQQYRLTVIELEPDSALADNLDAYFDYCTITQYYTMDNVNHTALTLFY